jgi:hypothetical protein
MSSGPTATFEVAGADSAFGLRVNDLKATSLLDRAHDHRAWDVAGQVTAIERFRFPAAPLDHQPLQGRTLGGLGSLPVTQTHRDPRRALSSGRSLPRRLVIRRKARSQVIAAHPLSSGRSRVRFPTEGSLVGRPGVECGGRAEEKLELQILAEAL